MGNKKRYRFATEVIHAAQEPHKWNGATTTPVFQTASYVHETAENLSDTFSGKKADFIYSRLSNPTNTVLEKKLCMLEGGQGAVVMSSGMSAITNTCMALLRAGDEFVSGNSLFMSTYLLFTSVFKKYDINAKLVPTNDLDELEKNITAKTRFIYMETIGNPGMDIPDLKKISEIAHRYGLPLIVDNTIATPYLCKPIEIGADVVIHSTTKFLSGHGNAPGGVVIDSGSFDWNQERFPDFKPFIERKGDLALLDKIWREHHINFGTTQAPFHSYLTMTGLETFVLRMERQLENAMSVANYLKDRPEVEWVNYPGLSDHPSHESGKKQFSGKGFGAMLTFGLKDQKTCFDMINNLELIYHLANLGDCKTLIIHPWSSQYVSFTDEVKLQLGIKPGLIRLSVGIEHIKDITNDLGCAISKTD
ncbi:MAG: O-acetylhomoserine aminocarboxypropyltransferase/cysteine synthase [Desulfobacterales bacterium]|nr:O-acetylhomoserine aminocarboxypropyltransferase/cysteine synthase [Desulfobacterales bacterium]